MRKLMWLLLGWSPDLPSSQVKAALFDSHLVLICTLSFYHWASLSLNHFWYHRPLVSPYSLGLALLSFFCVLLFLPLKSLQSFEMGPVVFPFYPWELNLGFSPL